MYFFETNKIKIINNFLGALVLLSLSQSVASEASLSSDSVTLENLIDLALRQNPEIRGFRAEVQSQDA